MRFLVDESTGRETALRLRAEGHDVVSVFDELRGAADDELLRRAHEEHRVIVTNDKDFGALVVRDQRPHAGVILLRMTDTSAPSKLSAIRQVVATYGEQLDEWLTVVTDRGVRRTRP